MKTIIIDGRIGKDAEVLSTKKGNQYVKFSLANDQYVNGENKTEWYDIISFDPFVIEKKAEYLKKGRYIIVTGTPSASANVNNGRLYLNLNINATSVELPSVGPKRNENGQVNEGATTYGASAPAGPVIGVGTMPAQPKPQAQQFAPQPQAQPQPQQFAPQAQPQQFSPQAQPQQMTQPQPQQFAPQAQPQQFAPQAQPQQMTQPQAQQFAPQAQPQQMAQPQPQQFGPQQTQFPPQQFGMAAGFDPASDSEDDLPF